MAAQEQKVQNESTAPSLPRLSSTETVIRSNPVAQSARHSANTYYIPKLGGAGTPIPLSSPSLAHQPPTTNPSTPASIKPDPVAVPHGHKLSSASASPANEPSPPGLLPSCYQENQHSKQSSPVNSPTDDTSDLVMDDPYPRALPRPRRSSISLRNDLLRPGSPYDTSRSDTLSAESPRGSSPNAKVHFSDTPNNGPITHFVQSASQSHHPVSGFKKRATVGPATHQMSKWLPPSTSSLAEALEGDLASPLRFRPRNSSVDVATLRSGLLTPPFTPLKKSDDPSSIRTPVNIQSPMEKLIRQTSLITPPDTIPKQHTRPFAGSRGPPVELLSDSDSTSPTRASPHSGGAGGKVVNSGMTLANQLKQLALSENSRRRSASNPTGPGFDFRGMSTPQRKSPASGLTPRYGELESSPGHEGSEHRRRSETLSTSATGLVPNSGLDGNPPRRVSVSHFQSRNDGSSLPGSVKRVGQGTGAPIFPASSSSIFASNLPSALAFSHPPASYPIYGLGKLEQGIDLSPHSQRVGHSPPHKSNNGESSPSTGSDQHRATERRQRYHTAPADGNHLTSLTQENPAFDTAEGYSTFDVRPDGSGLSTHGNLQYEPPSSKYAQSRLRPRSSTMAGVGNRRMLKRSLLSLRWNDEEIDEGVEGESPRMDDRSSPSGINPDSARSSSSTEEVDSMAFKPSMNPDVSRVSFERRSSDTVLLSRLPSWGTQASFMTRYCKILGLPPKLLGSMKGIVKVRNAFARYGDMLDIYVDTLSPLGFILVGFHDMRSISNMMEQGPQELGVAFGSYLKFEPISRAEVIQLAQDLDNPILSVNEATLMLHFDDPRGIITHDVLTEYLCRYGDLKVLKHVGYNQWHVEWFDDRRATAAQKQLVARDFADFQVSVEVPLIGAGRMYSTPSSSIVNHIPPNDEPLPVNPAINPRVSMLPPTIRPPPTMISAPEPYNNGLLYRYMADPYAGNYVFPWNARIPGPVSSPIYHQPPNPNISDTIPFSAPLVHPHDRLPPGLQQVDLQKHQHMVAATHRPRAFPFPGVPPSNVIDLDRIECGSDPRTTCMIKNIPNKITDEMLFNFVNEICPRGFDFLYLRMDFKARLNVGYAFINFLSVENVLKFAKAKLGVKWGVFLSEKTVQMCYASIQGKENLIEKFRNSAIMEEEESFRPKVYHSSGPLAGLPEPFPHANDLQRKARSQANAALSARPTMQSSGGLMQV